MNTSSLERCHAAGMSDRLCRRAGRFDQRLKEPENAERRGADLEIKFGSRCVSGRTQEAGRRWRGVRGLGVLRLMVRVHNRVAATARDQPSVDREGRDPGDG
jgi:hypothetical protein